MPTAAPKTDAFPQSCQTNTGSVLKQATTGSSLIYSTSVKAISL